MSEPSALTKKQANKAIVEEYKKFSNLTRLYHYMFNYFLELAGIKKPVNDKQESVLKPKECYKCRHKMMVQHSHEA